MQYLEQKDLATLFRVMYAENKTYHLVALLQFYTGARIQQVLNLKGEDIFEREGRYVVMIGAAKRGNTVTHALHLDENPEFDMSPLISLARSKGRNFIFGGLYRSNFNVALKRYAEAAGINSAYAHSHVFRHSAAMVIYDATHRIGAVTEFLGHKSPASAFVYLRENDSLRAQAAMDSLVLE